MITVGRAAWGAAFTIPAGRFVAPSARRFFVVHWPGSAVAGDERAVVRSIERNHRQVQGWAAAPGYNFLVGRSGAVYDGCGRDVRGVHSPPRNIDGWGVCVMVAPGEALPAAARDATRALYDWLCQVAGRRLAMSWHGEHFATECPGPALTAWVRAGMSVPQPPPSPPQPQPEGVPEMWCLRFTRNNRAMTYVWNGTPPVIHVPDNATQAGIVAAGIPVVDVTEAALRNFNGGELPAQVP